MAGLVPAIHDFLHKVMDAQAKSTAVRLRSFCEKNESCHRVPQPNVVMAGPAAGRVPAIHEFVQRRAWNKSGHDV
jgi:hypothetical protein